MEKIRGKIIVHLCGGAGINLGKSVFEEIEDLGPGFASFDLRYLDTSRANISNVKYPDKFTLVETVKATKDGLDGSGGERSKNADDIIEYIKKYLDDNKLLSQKVAEYHLVVFSASGGSGSVIGPMLTKALLERNIPTSVIMVGDSTNGLNAINTSKTIATMNSIAKMTKKAINIMYTNNQAHNDGCGLRKAEEKANRAIYNSSVTLALFLSNHNQNIDAQDMVMFLDQTQYKTINIKPGIYGMIGFSKRCEVPNGSIPISGRSLTKDDIDPDTGLTLLNHKAGIVLEENADELFNDQYPVHLISFANFFTTEDKLLKKVVDDYKNIMNQIQIEDIEDEEDPDENGLVF